MFKSICHIALFTDKMDEMLDFYTNKLGGKLLVLTRYKSYLNSPNRPQHSEIARKDPERIYNVYIEIAPGQSVELFPKQEYQNCHPEFNENLGYSHFALLSDDIYADRDRLLEKGVTMTKDISKGPSGTYQCWFHDPDNNYFEIMQYTEDSYQLKGHID